MSTIAPARVSILMADDDEDDRVLARDAFAEAGVVGDIRFVNDGQELLDYLREHPEKMDYERPAIVLLDLNMPRMSGQEALSELKHDDGLCEIPVIVLTTSRNETEIAAAYCAGASSFITKPLTLGGLVDVMRDLDHYWFSRVELPRLPD